MIAVSDAVLIVVSAAALSLGLYRWQSNVEQASFSNARPAVAAQIGTQGDITRADTAQSAAGSSQPSTINATASTGTEAAVVQTRNPQASANAQLDESQNTQSQVQNQPVVVVEQTPTASLDVANDDETTASNDAVVDVAPYGSYIVKPGDSLSLIALQYGTTVSTLQQINGIEGALITVGQEIRYPQPAN